MVATADSPLTIVTGDFNSVGIVANDIVYEGAMVGDNVAGYGRPLVAGDMFLGHSLLKVDNSGGGLAGAKEIRLRTGRYRGAVTLTGVLITDVKKEVYASDDNTLTLSASGNSRVGIVIRYEKANTAIVEFQTNEPFAESMDREVTYGDIEVGGAYQGTYALSTTKNYPIGTMRRTLNNGDAWCYGLALDDLVSYHGCGNSLGIALAIEALDNAQDIGDEEITITETGFTADELKGGRVIIYGAGDHAQNRVITGNDVSAAGETRICFAGQPLTVAVEAGVTQVEVFHNEYKALTHIANEKIAVMGIPAVNMPEGNYGWIRTWGPIVVSGSEDLSNPADGAREVAFVGNYGIKFRANATTQQLAGFILESGAAVAPSIMLTIKP